jgi:hypothetical protein
MRFVITSLLGVLILIQLCYSQEKPSNNIDSLIIKQRYDWDYIGENNYKKIYIVDTIVIDDPIIIRSVNYGGPFVMSQKLLSVLNDDIDFYFRPDVFILWPEPYWVIDFEDEIYKDFINYPEFGGCSFKRPKSHGESHQTYRFKKTPVFILALINVNHYHRKLNSESYFNIPISYSKYSYIKIVFPLCE